MGKKRVHEIAKDLNQNSKDIISALGGLGIEVKSHMSTLETKEIEKLYQSLGKAQGNRPAPAKAGGKAGNQPATAKSDGPRRSVRLSQYGPGLVDKVPQRPPDRRFVERPMYIPVPIPRAGSEKEGPAEAAPRAADPRPTGAVKPVAPRKDLAPEHPERPAEPQQQTEPVRPAPNVTRPPQARPYVPGTAPQMQNRPQQPVRNVQSPTPAQRPVHGGRPAPGGAPGNRPPQYGGRPAPGG
ncbi:MAG: translation initiation factor IF-2 N-terminal domain-containing protein, partial [Clostridia bacterium]|nr:translation initiation factor IF-2 N-terminal domain-containing protein [Clostridia bacterium]